MHGKVAETPRKSEERVGFDWNESFKRRVKKDVFQEHECKEWTRG